MKTAYKLILKSYLGPMVLTFFIVMFVLMMNFIWRYIDELVGKGLTLDVIGELMLYASATLIPMALPLATLLAAIMTLGNMGENYELLALKTAGVSLPRILKPLIILVGIIAVGSFFIANNLVPNANKKMYSLMYDIRQQKQSIEFQDGQFFSGIENLSIRVGRQDPQTKLLTDILLYDNRDPSGIMKTYVADSGYITVSDDKKFLLLTLFSGHGYEGNRSSKWFDESRFQHEIFLAENAVFDLEGFSLERSDNSLFNNSQTKNIAELQHEIDSLQTYGVDLMTHAPLLQDYVFKYDKSLVPVQSDTIPPMTNKEKKPVGIYDSLQAMNLDSRKILFNRALRNVEAARSTYSYNEDTNKATVAELYKYRVEWHRKMSLPISIIIFFLIGAPLGAIIRKGGLGTPIVISVLFFVVYYIISLTGEKMVKEGTWSAFSGMWISTMILLPIAIYLTYKATNDSGLLDSNRYLSLWRKVKESVKGYVKNLFSKNKIQKNVSGKM